MWLKNRRLARRLTQLGTSVDVSFLLYVNNENPITFSTQKDVFEYVKRYRSETAITKLQIFRIETYSL